MDHWQQQWQMGYDQGIAESNERIAKLQNEFDGVAYELMYMTQQRDDLVEALQDIEDTTLLNAASRVMTLCLNHGIRPTEFVAAVKGETNV